MFNINRKYIGIVEDIEDPLKIGRCRVRVPFLFGDIPTDQLPWAYQKYSPIFGKGGQNGAVSIPKKDAIVEITFNDGNLYSPEYKNLQELASDVKEQLQNEYAGTHILLFDGDEDLKIYYTPNIGITIYLKGSSINISNDKSISITHADTQSMIELAGGTITVNADSEINSTSGTRIKDTSKEIWINGKLTKLGTQPNYSAVLGEPLFLLLKQMATAIDGKLYPTPGVVSGLVEACKKFTLSGTVTVSK